MRTVLCSKCRSRIDLVNKYSARFRDVLCFQCARETARKLFIERKAGEKTKREVSINIPVDRYVYTYPATVSRKCLICDHDTYRGYMCQAHNSLFSGASQRMMLCFSAANTTYSDMCRNMFSSVLLKYAGGKIDVHTLWYATVLASSGFPEVCLLSGKSLNAMSHIRSSSFRKMEKAMSWKSNIRELLGRHTVGAIYKMKSLDMAKTKLQRMFSDR